jgi:hypothetical protein
MDQPPIPFASLNRHRRRLTLGLTAVALVAGGGVAIAAGQPATPGDAGATSAAPAPTPAKPGLGRGGALGLGGGVLHGEYVVPDGSGGYRTQVVQTGTIESVDDSSLTVASEDGYKRSYARTADTVVGGPNWAVTKNDDGSFTVRKSDAALATGQKVLVTGTLDGDKATATRIAARPDGDLPAGILKGLGAEMGDMGGRRGLDQLKEGLLQKFKQRMDDGTMPAMPMPGQKFSMPAPGQAKGEGGTVRRYEFSTPEGGTAEAVPVPAEPGTQSAPARPSRPVPAPAPAEPSASASSGSAAPA